MKNVILLFLFFVNNSDALFPRWPEHSISQENNNSWQQGKVTSTIIEQTLNSLSNLKSNRTEELKGICCFHSLDHQTRPEHIINRHQLVGQLKKTEILDGVLLRTGPTALGIAKTYGNQTLDILGSLAQISKILLINDQWKISAKKEWHLSKYKDAKIIRIHIQFPQEIEVKTYDNKFINGQFYWKACKANVLTLRYLCDPSNFIFFISAYIYDFNSETDPCVCKYCKETDPLNILGHTSFENFNQRKQLSLTPLINGSISPQNLIKIQPNEKKPFEITINSPKKESDEKYQIQELPKELVPIQILPKTETDES